MIWTEYTEQASVTLLPQRIVAVLVVLGLIVLALWGMRRGWVHRMQRQVDIPAPADAPAGDVEWLLAVDGTYLGCSRAGDWLDRIAVHELGVPSRATCRVASSGIWLDRVGARSVFLPATAVQGVRVDRGVAATVRDRDSVVVIRSRLGDAVVEMGFRPATADAQRDLLEAMVTSGYVVELEASA